MKYQVEITDTFDEDYPMGGDYVHGVFNTLEQAEATVARLKRTDPLSLYYIYEVESRTPFPHNINTPNGFRLGPPSPSRAEAEGL